MNAVELIFNLPISFQMYIVLFSIYIETRNTIKMFSYELF